MKILLLGSQGNLATALVSQSALRDDIRLIGWDKAEVDITDRVLLEKKIADIKPDVVINTVAYNDVDRCETPEGEVLARTLNVDTVRSLAEICLDQNRLLVHYSSDYVFSGESGPYDESAEASPISVYGESKAKGERELIRLSGRGLKWYLIRTARLFGPKGEGSAAKPSFFDIMTNLAEKQSTLKVVADETGSFTYTSDLADLTLKLLEEAPAYGIYHAVNSGEASWYEAVQYLFTKLGRSITIEAVPGSAFARPARRPNHSTLLMTKLPPLRSWQSALEEYLASNNR